MTGKPRSVRSMVWAFLRAEIRTWSGCGGFDVAATIFFLLPRVANRIGKRTVIALAVRSRIASPSKGEPQCRQLATL